MPYRRSLIATQATASALPALAEMNVYPTRQARVDRTSDGDLRRGDRDRREPRLDPGYVERLQAEGARSPAELMFTVDIANLSQIVEAGLTEAVESEALQENVSEGHS